jgi:membrane protein DedA with SNARE-associated domain
VTSFLAQHGVWAVFLLMALDALFPAFSELVMVYGGALASGALAHDLEVFGTPASGFDAYLAIALAGTIGYLVGALVGWGIGHYGGRPFLERRGRLFHLDDARLDRAEQWFERWGDSAAFVGRLTPGVRSFVSIPAGVFRAPLGRYTLLTAAGSAIWCFGLAGIGWALGSSWERFDHAFKYAEFAIVIAIVLGVAYWIVRRRRSITMARRATDSAR